MESKLYSKKKAHITNPIGDTAYIVTEITAKSLNNSEIYYKCKTLVVRDAEVFTKAIEIVNGNLDINVINSPEEGKYEHGTVDLIDLNNINMDELEYGKVQAQCGRGSYEYIEKSVQLALKDEVKAL